MIVKKAVAIMLGVFMIFMFSSCEENLNINEGNGEIENEIPNDEKENTDKSADENAEEKVEDKVEDKNNTQEASNPVIVITMEDGGVMELELYPDIAPITVENFMSLAESGFYDGITFHRIVKGFMIQGGDPNGTGMGGSDKTIKGEFSSNGVKNDLSHTRGVISMARSKALDSASSQFFIVHEDSDFLDGQYAAFGKLVSGEDALDALAATPVGADGETPVKKPVIKTITIK